MQSDAYRLRLSAEKEIYRDRTEIHELPRAFHYWSNRYIRPRLRSFGFNTPDELFALALEKQCAFRMGGARFVSIGAGNCDIEIEAALHLRRAGHSRFSIECLELNEVMLSRGAAAANAAGVRDNLLFTPVDANQWTPPHRFDAVICNQSLHHLVNLEGMFDHIQQCLQPKGTLVMSDLIGRNGHQRWPEALTVVNEFWRQLPPSYRVNQVLNRYEESFLDWDCSGEGFEGIRSQDILPLLLERFHFQLFFGFGNVIDPFLDRSFGPHFGGLTAWDRDFLDRVHQRNEEELVSGRCKATHMIAVAGLDPGVDCVFDRNLSPAFSVRPTTAPLAAPLRPQDPYVSSGWPDAAQEAILAARRAAQLETRLEEMVRWGADLDRKHDERTEWALRLREENREQAAQIASLEDDRTNLRSLVAERTAWAQRLDRELETRTAQLTGQAEELAGELTVRTAWARDLERQLAERTQWAFLLRDEAAKHEHHVRELRRELESYFRTPALFLRRWAGGVRDRWRNRLFPKRSRTA